MQKHKIYTETGFKYRLKAQKTGDLKFISHLDWQKLIYTAIRRSGLKINYSQGFNPTPKISIGIALPLFIEAKNEYIDIELQQEVADNIIKEKLNSILPGNSRISDVVKIPKDKSSIQKRVCWAVYKAIPLNSEINTKINIETIAKEFLLKQNIVIDKHSKKGIKKVNIRPGVYSLNFDKENNILEFTLKAGGGCIKEPPPENPQKTGEGCCIKEPSPENPQKTGEGCCIKEPSPENPQKTGEDCMRESATDNPGTDERLLMDEETSVSSIRADEFLKILTPEINWRITREKLLDNNFNEIMN